MRLRGLAIGLVVLPVMAAAQSITVTSELHYGPSGFLEVQAAEMANAVISCWIYPEDGTAVSLRATFDGAAMTPSPDMVLTGSSNPDAEATARAFAAARRAILRCGQEGFGFALLDNRGRWDQLDFIFDPNGT